MAIKVKKLHIGKPKAQYKRYTRSKAGNFTLEELEGAIKKLVPAGKPELLENNIKTVEAGYNYED